MSAEVSFTKRAAAELSRCFNSMTVSRTSSNNTATPSTTASAPSTSSMSFTSTTSGKSDHKHALLDKKTSKDKKIAEMVVVNGHDHEGEHNPRQLSHRRSSRGGPPPKAPPKTARARCWNYLLNLKRPVNLEQLWLDADFLKHFFSLLEPSERPKLAQVCKKWCDILYSDVKYWRNMKYTLYFNELRQPQYWTTLMMQDYSDENAHLLAQLMCSPETLALTTKNEHLALLYGSLKRRRFNTIQLSAANDADLIELATQATLNVMDTITDLSVHNSVITDKGVEVLLASISPSLLSIQLVGCNELSDSGLWTGLVPNLKSLTIQDCINVSDETVAAVCQLLPALNTLRLQAYHVTDASMAYFSTSMLRETLRVLVLQHCWEITNQGVMSIAHSLPNLTSLSLSGCSKISDEALEVVAEQLRGLHSLDLSWCPRISDASIEFIACDLADSLRVLVLDRCMHITDVGVGYIATMARLQHLSLRWCPLVRDFGMQTISSLGSLKTLSVAGCTHVSINGLSFLARLPALRELELTNCPAASAELVKYLVTNLPRECTIIT